jgi:transcriptional regulator with XRE-family HTH domain
VRFFVKPSHLRLRRDAEPTLPEQRFELSFAALSGVAAAQRRANVRPLTYLQKENKNGGGPMKGHDFKRWRKSLDLSQKDAADVLGLKRRVVQYYEKGERDGDPVKIPRTVRLACYAISVKVMDYQGPERDKKKDKDRERESLADGGEGDERKRDKKDKKKKKKKKDKDE